MEIVLLCASVSVAGSICSGLTVLLKCSFKMFQLWPSVSPVPSWFTKAVGQSARGEGKTESKGERSVFIIEVGSADVLSSLSTQILPLACFSVSHFSHHSLHQTIDDSKCVSHYQSGPSKTMTDILTVD